MLKANLWVAEETEGNGAQLFRVKLRIPSKQIPPAMLNPDTGVTCPFVALGNARELSATKPMKVQFLFVDFPELCAGEVKRSFVPLVSLETFCVFCLE